MQPDILNSDSIWAQMNVQMSLADGVYVNFLVRPADVPELPSPDDHTNGLGNSEPVLYVCGSDEERIQNSLQYNELEDVGFTKDILQVTIDKHVRPNRALDVSDLPKWSYPGGVQYHEDTSMEVILHLLNRKPEALIPDRELGCPSVTGAVVTIVAAVAITAAAPLETASVELEALSSLECKMWYCCGFNRAVELQI
ncbi:hypothetical protein AG1IA_06574 [Rhizoctonia solani AG-1 IA]|uniref:Uncharacterized protein n=1 Tax=Thanatephorus cucumeris (strain AG1-IA) TaxID=983506 RepID=L8WMM1_THACA|nr:hypothetical protein AG1IA_06574 [Rhizoctonia solani AG-1 IA]